MAPHSQEQHQYQLQPVEAQTAPACESLNGKFPQRPRFCAAEQHEDSQREQRQQLDVAEAQIEALVVEDVLPARWAQLVGVAAVTQRQHRWARQHKGQLPQRVLGHRASDALARLQASRWELRKSSKAARSLFDYQEYGRATVR